MLAQGIDPSERKKKAKAMAREWFEAKTLNPTDAYRKQLRFRLEKHIFPFSGDIPFSVVLDAVPAHTKPRRYWDGLQVRPILNPQAVVGGIAKFVSPMLDKLHFPVKAFRYSVVQRKAGHSRRLLLPE